MNVYLDNGATTRPDDAVIETVSSSMREAYGNPSSVHSAGQQAAAKVEAAREILAGGLNAHPREIIFTSGGTESDNLAILGYARANRNRGRHIITTNIEHHGVLHPCEQLEREGFEVTYLPVDEAGSVNVRQVKDALREDTILVSVMYANNEIGTIQPIKEIGEVVRKKGAAFHVDAVQAFGKQELDVERLNVTLLSASAHKCHGPKGVGLLYIKSGTRLSPVLFGGGQEHNLRSGTVNATLIAGFGKAAELMWEGRAEREEQIAKLRDYFVQRVENEIPGAELNGSRERRMPENANFSFKGAASDALLYAMDLRGVCLSVGSACAAGSIEPTHVISAIGKADFGASARFTLSKYTTKEELDYTVDALKEVLARLRA